MEINIRTWTFNDLAPIRQAWLQYCQNATRSDMQLRPDADSAMKHWLNACFREPRTLGLVAESDGKVVGFLIGRIDDWESVPPIIEPRRIGRIDAVHVAEDFRRQGVGSRLISTAIQTMKASDVISVETIYDGWNDAAARAWHRAGFAPWMVHAYRML